MRFSLSALSVFLAALSFVSAQDTVINEDDDGPGNGVVLPEGSPDGVYDYFNGTNNTPAFTPLSALGIVISRDEEEDESEVEQLPALPVRHAKRAADTYHCFSAKYGAASGDTAVRALAKTIAGRNGYVNSPTLAVIVNDAVQYVCNRKAPQNIYFDSSLPETASKKMDSLCGRPKAGRFDAKDVIHGYGRTKSGKPFCNY